MQVKFHFFLKISPIFPEFLHKKWLLTKNLVSLVTNILSFCNHKDRLFRIAQRLKAFASTEQSKQIIMSRDCFKSFLKSLYQFWRHLICMLRMSNFYSKISETYPSLSVLNSVKNVAWIFSYRYHVLYIFSSSDRIIFFLWVFLESNNFSI